MEKGGLFAWWCRVQERGALRRHRGRPKTNGFSFRPAATPFGLEGDWRSLVRVAPVVASIGFLFYVEKGGKGKDPGA